MAADISSSEVTAIKRTRLSLGLTQKDLALHSGVSQSLIAKIEAGLIDPSYSKTRKILDTLSAMGRKAEIKASEMMCTTIINISPDESLRKVISKMKRYGISQLPVIEGKQPVGMISESIILDALMGDKSPETTVSEVMEDAPPVISKDAGQSIITGLLKFYPIVIVSEKGKIHGIITKSDLITRAFR